MFNLPTLAETERKKEKVCTVDTYEKKKKIKTVNYCVLTLLND